jgi:hypothetical protein
VNLVDGALNQFPALTREIGVHLHRLTQWLYVDLWFPYVAHRCECASVGVPISVRVVLWLPMQKEKSKKCRRIEPYVTPSRHDVFLAKHTKELVVAIDEVKIVRD